MRSVVAILLSATAAGCIDAGAFRCTGNGECGGGGICLAGGCAFPDPSCASGFRFGEYAPDMLAGSCWQGIGGGADAFGPPTDGGASDAREFADASVFDGPPSSTCEDVCPGAGGSCVDGVCVILCQGPGACLAGVVCPPSVPCHVSCQNGDSCGAGVTCNSPDCEIDCSGRHSCQGPVSCGGNDCRVRCQGDNSCEGGIACDAARCDIRCEHQDACVGPIVCGPGRCDVDCTLGGCNDVDCLAACACDVLCGSGQCFAGIECPLDCSDVGGCTSTGCDRCGGLP